MADKPVENKSKGKGILKNALDWLAPEQPAQAPVTAKPEAATAPVSAPAPTPSRTASNILQGKSGVSNSKIRTQLQEAVAAKNKDGLDFFEFNKALDKEKTMRDPERYAKVFNFMLDMAPHDGPSLRSVLIETGQFYLSVLDEEKAGMEQEFKNLEDERIGAKRAEIDQSVKDIDELERQKAEIEQKLQEKRVRVGELQDQVSTDDITLQRQRSDFNVTFDELYGEYQVKIKNIEQFIPNEAPATSDTNQ